MVIGQVNQQQMAVASNLSATEGLNQVLRSELERKTDTDNATKVNEKSNLQKALDGKKGGAGTQIIADLAAKLAQNMPTNKVLNNLEQDYEFLMKPQQEPGEDLVNIQNPINAILNQQKTKKQTRQGQGAQAAEGEETLAQRSAADLKEYIGAYSQVLINGGQEAKKKMDKLENQLLDDKGVSLKDLKALKSQVANSVRSEIMQQVKKAYLKHALAESKSLESIIADKEMNNVFDYAFNNKNLGGYDFGGKDGHLQGAVHRATGEVRQEMREYIDDKLSQQIMKKAMGEEGKEVEKEIEGLLKLGQKMGFDLQGFLSKIPKMKDDLGLNPLIAYEEAPMAAGANMSDNNREGHKYQYTQEEEKEIITDKLRAIYLRRAMYGDMRTVLETQFKMIKLKNGLIKLGVKNFDQVASEGKALAKVKLVKMLQEAFEERATYAKLSGEAWKMTERKIKTVLKNLERLGIKPSQSDLNQLRDKANEKMYREAEHELTLINTAIKARGELKYLTNKRKLVTGILERVAEESGFQAPGHEIELSVKEAC